MQQALPLQGLKVVDFSQGGAGPYCAQLLGDFGAEVIKIEPPRGDWAREMGAMHSRIGMSATFAAFNRNKRGLCLDLADPGAVEVARRLCAEADVVVEAFRPGVMQRLGLGADALRAAHPRLVYCAVSGYGQTGPNVALPASDSVMQAYGGFMSIVGEEGSGPLRVANIVSDMLSGTNAFASVLLALLRRTQTGEGGVVGTSLLDSIIGFQAAIFSEFLLSGQLPQRRGNRHPLIAASGVFQAADGYVAFTVLDHYWRTFCETMDLQSLLVDPRFANSETRQANRAAVAEAMQSAVTQRTVREVLDMLGPKGVLCAPVQDYASLARDPQVLHNELISSLQLANGEQLPMVRPPMTVDATGRAHWTPPPSVGEHSLQILRDDLGLPPAEVDALLTRRAVLVAPL